MTKFYGKYDSFLIKILQFINHPGYPINPVYSFFILFTFFYAFYNLVAQHLHTLYLTLSRELKEPTYEEYISSLIE